MEVEGIAEARSESSDSTGMEEKGGQDVKKLFVVVAVVREMQDVVVAELVEDRW